MEAQWIDSEGQAVAARRMAMQAALRAALPLLLAEMMEPGEEALIIVGAANKEPSVADANKYGHWYAVYRNFWQAMLKAHFARYGIKEE